MSNPLVEQVTREQVEQALVRAEHGVASVEDANLIRSYLRMLSSWLEMDEQDGLRANTE